jgi:hypothetical protein
MKSISRNANPDNGTTKKKERIPQGRDRDAKDTQSLFYKSLVTILTMLS